MEVHGQVPSSSRRSRPSDPGRPIGLLRSRQRRRVRPGVRSKVVWRVSTAPFDDRVRRVRHRPCHRAAHRTPSRGARLGPRRSRPRRDLLFHTLIDPTEGVKMDSKMILLVEDNPNDEALTLRALKKNNILNPVVVVRDGSEALDWLFARGVHAGRDATVLPQVVLLDLKLPKMSGIEVLRAVRDNPRTKRLPVVLLTSSKEEQDVIAGYDMGANSYVRKPVDFGEFAEAIRQLGLYWLVLNETAPPK